MGNQIRAELYRLRQRRFTWWGLPALLALCAGLMALGSGSGVVAGESSGPVYALCRGLRQLLFMGVFFAPACASAVFSDQYKHATLKNEAVFGISRTGMYLARLAAAVLLGLLMAVACFGMAFALSVVFFSDLGATLDAFARLIPWVAGALPIWIAACSLHLCLEFSLPSDGLAITLYILYLIPGWIILGAFAAVGGGPVFLGGFSLPQLLFAVHPLAPFSPAAIQLGGISPQAIYLDGGWGASGLCWLIGLGWVLVTTVAGVGALRRRELR